MISDVDPALIQRWCYGLGELGGSALVIACLVMANSLLSATHDYSRLNVFYQRVKSQML